MAGESRLLSGRLVISGLASPVDSTGALTPDPTSAARQIRMPALVCLPHCLNSGGLEAAVAGDERKAEVEAVAAMMRSGMSGTRFREIRLRAVAMCESSGKTNQLKTRSITRVYANSREHDSRRAQRRSDAALRMPNREHPDLAGDYHIVDVVARLFEQQTAHVGHRRLAV